MNYTGVLVLTSLMLVAPVAAAQADLTCDDITFTAAMREEFPDIDNACIDVVERDGRRLALVEIEILRVRRGNVTFRFKEADGTFGPTQVARPPGNMRVRIGNQRVRVRDLARGQELNIYLPADRWEIVLIDEDDDLSVLSVSDAMLPTTASHLPLIGLLGLVLTAAGGTVTAIRRRLLG